MEDKIALLTQGAEHERNWAIAQLDVARLAHDSFGVRDGKVGEAAAVFFESVGALGIRLA